MTKYWLLLTTVLDYATYLATFIITFQLHMKKNEKTFMIYLFSLVFLLLNVLESLVFLQLCEAEGNLKLPIP